MMWKKLVMDHAPAGVAFWAALVMVVGLAYPISFGLKSAFPQKADHE